MKKAALLLSLVVASFGVLKAQEANTAAPASKAKMSFEYETYDYGTIMQDNEQKNGDSYFKFTNTGTEPLIITKAKGSCGCTVPDAPLNKPFAPGESGDIKVHYATNRVGNFNKNVTLETNAGTYTLYIKGNVEPLPAEQTMPVKENSGAPVNE